MNLRELKPRGELDKYVDKPTFDEDSERPVTSLWEIHAGFIPQPRREPWARGKGLMPKQFAGMDGEDGDDGIDGEDGQDGEQGPQGPAGQDGTDATIPAGVIVFATVSDLGDGWALCDGTNGTPDLRGRFVVSVGPSVGANAPTYALGDVGGKNWHGQSENNHNDHSVSHVHCFPTLTQHTFISCATGCTVYVPTADFVPDCGTLAGEVYEWCGTTSLPSHAEPETSLVDGFDYAKHYGPENSNSDTDNRPPFYALYAHMKL